jgi:Uma2 family endonuclease
VEIVSPDNVERNWQIKYLEYQAARIPEYWVVDPGYQRVQVYGLTEAGTYQPLAVDEGWLRSQALPGFGIRPEWLWQDPPPTTLAVARGLGLLDQPA